MNALSPSRPDRPSYGLWSLWEMLSFYPANLVQLAKEVGRLSMVFSNQKIAEVKRKKIDNGEDKTTFEKFGQIFSDHALFMCARQAERIVKALDTDDLTNAEFSKMLEELYNRMVDECNISVFISLDSAESKYYEPCDPLFGKIVQDKIPKIIEDIDEAGNAWGFGELRRQYFI